MYNVDFKSWVCESEGEIWCAHGPTIAENQDGSLVAAWFAGLPDTMLGWEGFTEVQVLHARKVRDDPVIESAIHIARSEDGGKSWGSHEILEDTPKHANQLPVFFFDPDNVLWLTYVTDLGGNWCRGGGYMFFKKSTDGGKTWSEGTQMDIPVHPHLHIVCKPVFLNDGTMVFVADDETSGGGLGSSRAIISTDGGKSWIAQQTVEEKGVKLREPTVVQLSDGSLLMYMRSHPVTIWERKIWESRSTDGGKTWSKPKPTELPNNDSMIDVIRMRNGNFLMAYNPTDRLDWPYCRTPLTIAISKDDCTTWRDILTVESSEHYFFSYPTIFQGEGDTVHLVYTYCRDRIRYAHLTIPSI